MGWFLFDMVPWQPVGNIITVHFSTRWDVLPPNLLKPRSHKIGCYNDRFALKFDRHLHSPAAKGFVKYQIDWKSLNANLAASELYEILG